MGSREVAVPRARRAGTVSVLQQLPLAGAAPPGAGRGWKPVLGSGTASGARLGACDEFPELHPTKQPLGAALAASRLSK